MRGEDSLQYGRNSLWRAETDDFVVLMTDQTFQKHFKAYLEAQGICSVHPSVLREQARRLEEQQYEALQQFRRGVSYWLTCGDSEVTIKACTPQALQRLQAQRR